MAKRKNPVLRFFIHRKTMDEQVQQPVEQVAEAPVEQASPAVEEVANVAEQAPVEEKKSDEPNEVAPAVSEDRSVFNCAECKGEGLKDEATLCPACKGTGKVV